MDIKKNWLELTLAGAAAVGVVSVGVAHIGPVLAVWWAGHWVLVEIVGGLALVAGSAHKWLPFGWKVYATFSDRMDIERMREQHYRMLEGVTAKIDQGFDTEYHNQALGFQIKVHNPYTKAQRVQVQEIANQENLQIEAPGALPNLVRYEDIRTHIPADHALVGIDQKGIITRQRAIKALTWVVGGSGSGKTNTVCIRVDEDYEWGHRFLVIDPHWFKDDSMYNAIKGYADRFLMPVAYETEDILRVLDTFLSEFKRRKAGGSWEFPITILIDEVGSLTTDKPETDEEKEMIDKIKQVARICGQESRGFEMTGMYISQDAAGLAWLRKRAIMVLAHQLLMMSERLLACNQNVEVARDMDTWPIGRTLVYGIGFKEGQKVVQQPVFEPKVVEANPVSNVSGVFNPFPEAETASEAKSEIVEGSFSFSDELSLKKEKETVEAGIRETVKRMKKRGMADREIAPLVGLGGRKYYLYQQVCEEEGIVVSQAEEEL